MPRQRLKIGIVVNDVDTEMPAAAVGPIMSNVEQPKYTVVERYGDVEIRDYAPMIVAEVEVPRRAVVELA